MAERWLTYQQAGDLLGMSAEAVRQRARRLGWRTQPGNEGRALVLVPDGVEVRPRVRPAVQPPVQPAGQTAEAADLAELRERAAKAEGESATLREQVESERARADRAETRAGQAEREREAARIAAAAAEGEAKGLREAAEREAAVRREAEARERQAREAAERELAEWTAGGPLARAFRALLYRRGRAP